MTYEYEPTPTTAYNLPVPSAATTQLPTSGQSASTTEVENRRFNAMAVIAFFFSLFTPFTIGAIVVAHFALGDIKRSNERGRGLAIATLVIGYTFVALAIAASVIFTTLLVSAFQEWEQQLQHLRQFGDLGQVQDQFNNLQNP
jgi:predicted PurR-regulated permease PerM